MKTTVNVPDAEVGGLGDQAMAREVAQLVAEIGGSADHHSVHLVDGLGARLDGGTPCDAKDSQLLDPVVTGLRRDVRCPCQHRTRGSLGIDGVGLPAVPAQLAVGTADLHHGAALRLQETRQAGAIRSGALHAIPNPRCQ